MPIYRAVTFIHFMRLLLFKKSLHRGKLKKKKKKKKKKTEGEGVVGWGWGSERLDTHDRPTDIVVFMVIKLSYSSTD